MGWIRRLAAAALVLAAAFNGASPARDTPQAEAKPTAKPAIATIAVESLPREARATLTLIDKGGPFPYDKDGTVFGNFERRLPIHPRGYYREYTVKTPGERSRGARRIIAGKAGERYYTDDHYDSFKLVRFPEKAR